MIRQRMAGVLRKLGDVAMGPHLRRTEDDMRREILASQFLLPLAGRYVPWSRAALAPSAIAAVMNDIVMNRRNRIMELGGGVSTIYIARLLAKQDRGRLVTVDQDGEWLGFLQGFLESEGVSDRVSLIHAALSEVKYSMAEGQSTSHWYAESPILNALGDEKIDCLVVDGPGITAQGAYSRFPAIPVLASRLASGYMVLADDACRKGERTILPIWERQLNVEFVRIGGYAVATKNTLYKPYL